MAVYASLLIVTTLLGSALGDIAEDLQEAVATGNVDRVKSLLESGADARA